MRKIFFAVFFIFLFLVGYFYFTFDKIDNISNLAKKNKGKIYHNIIFLEQNKIINKEGFAYCFNKESVLDFNFLEEGIKHISQDSYYDVFSICGNEKPVDLAMRINYPEFVLCEDNNKKCILIFISRKT